MQKLMKVFAIIDPTTDNQLVLKRAERIAKLRGAKILAHCCIYSNVSSQDKEALKRAETKRHELWLEHLIAPLREAGVDIDYQIHWDPEWRDNLGIAANESGCDLVIKASKTKTLPGRLRKTADWQLLRTANMPVFLMKRKKSLESAKILAAIKADDADDVYKKMNENIMRVANEIVRPYEDGEVHVVRAYKDWDDFINPADLAKRCGVDRTRAHCATGAPEDAIQQIANEIGAELVVIGAIAAKSMSGRIFGNTVERLLDKLECDVVTVVGSK